ncbi:MAG: O-antigen ligase family protein [Gammaproteobacteria bacterium]|nr:O-antigen ligase family protein [Gammaproteobacteria bacterium]
MTAYGSDSQTGVAALLRRDPAAWLKAADIALVLFALSLPWSTSLASIFAVAWVLMLIPVIELRSFLRSLGRPACALPIALFALALLGTLWATDISWAARLRGINPAAKLLAIPILIYHFERSARGVWIAMAFLASCTVVMLASWLMLADPWLFYDPVPSPGVPVKNYIAQSQEFALCAFGALGIAVHLFNRQRKLALALMALSIAFLANMAFVVSSRTVLICIPALLILFAVRHFNRRGILILLAGAVIAGALAWAASPSLRQRMLRIDTEYQKYHDSSASTSTGMRLEFWRKSLRFFGEAPVVGHGTGSTRALFERDAVGKTGVSAEIVGNPHNQTLNVAVQWGTLGVVVLYAMWLAHAGLFVGVAGPVAWVGLVAVTENFMSSLFNSHLFDFTEGWIYVLAVGVAGGMVWRDREAHADRGAP